MFIFRICHVKLGDYTILNLTTKKVYCQGEGTRTGGDGPWNAKKEGGTHMSIWHFHKYSPV